MASNITVNPNQLGDEVSKLVKQYSDEVVQNMPEIVKEVTQDTVKELKKSASQLFGGSKYNRSFKSKKVNTVAGRTEYVIYSTEYRVAHLLENGHIIKNQTGIPYGTTQARPHWAPAEEHAADALEEKLTGVVQEAEI